ncbi:ABC transporter permease [Cohnella sp. GCM10027633]|uniref:ABC transporter permease n=1 Tax=unclassified Cohnella TaxID=2636738 RepID=UPI003636CB55
MSVWVEKLRPRLAGMFRGPRSAAERTVDAERARRAPPFWVIVQKEFGDHIRSWRFAILLGIVVLACVGSIYTAVTALKDGVAADGGGTDTRFLFLSMFTVSDGTLPSFLTFLSFLAPLIGLSLGFDAINTERGRGTLSRVLAQPVHRDDLLNAKFVAGLLLIAVVVFSLGFLVMGMGLFTIGYPPSPEEFGRVVLTLLLTTVYVGLWLNVSLFFSVRFKQAATSALSGIALWIFFLVFYGMIVSMIGNATAPTDPTDAAAVLGQSRWMTLLERLSPANLFQEAASTMLLPDVRTLSSFVTQEQAYRAISAPLSLGQSALLVWPHVVALVAETAVMFVASYLLFMRQEVRSRS